MSLASITGDTSYAALFSGKQRDQNHRKAENPTIHISGLSREHISMRMLKVFKH